MTHRYLRKGFGSKFLFWIQNWDVFIWRGHNFLTENSYFELTANSDSLYSAATTATTRWAPLKTLSSIISKEFRARRLPQAKLRLPHPQTGPKRRLLRRRCLPNGSKKIRTSLTLALQFPRNRVPRKRNPMSQEMAKVKASRGRESGGFNVVKSKIRKL